MTRVVLRDDLDSPAREDDVEFKITYAGPLFAYKWFAPEDRWQHIHALRKKFHVQLKQLWDTHPTFQQIAEQSPKLIEIFDCGGFNWQPLVTQQNNLLCALDIQMLRPGHPGGARTDIDNRLKTIFDALKPHQGGKTKAGPEIPKRFQPEPDCSEDPFYVLVHDDSLITRISVTTDTLLEEVVTDPPTPRDNAVRLVIHVSIRPFHVTMNNLHMGD